MLRISAFAITEGGTAHRVNEDSFQLSNKIYPDTLDHYEEKAAECQEKWQVYSVSDGLGGPGIGDIAGRLAQDLLKDEWQRLTNDDPTNFNFPVFAQAYLSQADELLQYRLNESPNESSGCSLALLLIKGNEAFTLSVGSARIMFYRQGKLYRLTQDHRLGNSWRDRPLLFLGHHPGSTKLKAQNMKRLTLQDGDEILLLTDGVTLLLSDEEISQRLAESRSFKERLRRLHRVAHERSAEDNQTVLGLQIHGGAEQVASRQGFPGFADLPYEHHDGRLYQNMEEECSGQLNLHGWRLFALCFGLGLLLALIVLLVFYHFMI